MTGSRASGWACIFVWGAVATLVSCHSGAFGHRRGSPCASSDECAESLVCDYGRCREQCSEDAQCPGGACVQSSANPGAQVCTVDAEQSCGATGCPAPLACGIDDVCRTGCDAVRPCPGQKLCVQMACFDKVPDGGVGDADAPVDAKADGGDAGSDKADVAEVPDVVDARDDRDATDVVVEPTVADTDGATEGGDGPVDSADVSLDSAGDVVSDPPLDEGKDAVSEPDGGESADEAAADAGAADAAQDGSADASEGADGNGGSGGSAGSGGSGGSGATAGSAGQDGSVEGGTELCNYIDDNGDGRVDEGFTYVEVPGSRHSVAATPYSHVAAGVSRGPSTAVLTWMAGDGTPSDTIVVQVVDLLGAPVAPPRTFKQYQSSNHNVPSWLGDRHFLTATTRWYDCGGTSSTTCTTYGFSVKEDGTTTWGPAELFKDTPIVSGRIAAGGEHWVVSQREGSAQARVRTFTPAGAAGSVDRTLLTLATGQASTVFSAATDGARIVWLYDERGDGGPWEPRMLVTDLSGAVTGGPFILAVSVGFGTSGTWPVLVNGVVHAVMSDGNLYRWSPSGSLLGKTPLLISPFLFVVPASDGAQILYFAQDGAGMLFGRVSLAGEVVQQPTKIITEATFRGGVVPVPAGAIVAGSRYYPGQVYWTRVACP